MVVTEVLVKAEAGIYSQPPTEVFSERWANILYAVLPTVVQAHSLEARVWRKCKSAYQNSHMGDPANSVSELISVHSILSKWRLNVSPCHTFDLVLAYIYLHYDSCLEIIC